MRSLRVRIAMVLIATAIVLNVIILVRAEESPGWPVAATVALGAAGIALLSERRPWQ